MAEAGGRPGEWLGGVSTPGHTRVRETLPSSVPAPRSTGTRNRADSWAGEATAAAAGSMGLCPQGSRTPDVGFSVTEGHVSGATSRRLPGPSASGRGPDGRHFAVKLVPSVSRLPTVFAHFCLALVIADLERVSFCGRTLNPATPPPAFIRGLFF